MILWVMLFWQFKNIKKALNTVKLHGQVKGDGQPLIMLHGLFGSLENLGVLSRKLAETYQVHALDLRNHGRSPHADTMNYQSMAADVLAYIRQHDLQQVVIIGHSMGGKVAMQVVLDAPARVACLVVLDIAPVTYGNRHGNVFQGLQSIDLTTIKNRIEAEEVLSGFVKELPVRQFLLKNMVKGKDGFSWRMNLQGIQQSYSDIVLSVSDSVWEGRTLFIRGELSDYITIEHREDILRRFPNAKVMTVNNTGHWLHAEKPTAVLNVIRRFLSSEA